MWVDFRVLFRPRENCFCVFDSRFGIQLFKIHLFRFSRKPSTGSALSPNAAGSFLEKLGMDGTKRRAFYQKRADSVIADHHIAIDGTLKQDSSKVNDLSAFSYKARTRGCREVSVLYAYDLEAMEPICAEVFPDTDQTQRCQDLEPETAYTCYADRWLLELVFYRYKSDERLDKTNVRGNFLKLYR